MKKTIYQTGTINSLIHSVYEGDQTIADLKEYGDFGLGTFDLVDGELIVCDGHYYRADHTGKVTEVADNIKTPFAVVNNFVAESEITLDELFTIEDLEQTLVSNLKFQNYIHSIRIDGYFEHISLRSEKCQPRPFRDMDQSMPELQCTFEASDIKGTLVGVWFPQYMEQLNVPGFHLHFVCEDRQLGGHVFNFKMKNAKCYVQKNTSLLVDSIQTPEFAKAKLYTDDQSKVHAVEKQR